MLAICSLFSTTLTTPAEIPKRFVPPKSIFEKRNFVKEIAKWVCIFKNYILSIFQILIFEHFI